MFDLLSKIVFLRRKPKVIVVGGGISNTLKSALDFILENYPESNKDKVVLLDLQKIGSPTKAKFWLENSSLPILLVSPLGEIPPEDIVFASEKSAKLENLANSFPQFGRLILSFDDETVREIGDKLNIKRLTFGFDERADFKATDCHFSKDGTAFKLNFKGNVLPVWLNRLVGKKNIYTILASLAVSEVLDFNLVEISQVLRKWQGVEGEGTLIDGIEGTILLNNSENANGFSMIEALEILGEIGKEEGNRRIALLGDVLGIGKYTIEAHETIGEKVAQNADILFTIGERAKFIAQGAREKGMGQDRIFEFSKVEDAVEKLKQEMKRGDLILIDGSKELKISTIVENLRKKQ